MAGALRLRDFTQRRSEFTHKPLLICTGFQKIALDTWHSLCPFCLALPRAGV